MSKNYKSVRMFENQTLENLSHVHPITPLIFWAPIASYFFYRSFLDSTKSTAAIGALAIFGFLSWTLTEYILHRYVFHFEGESEFSKKFHFLVHGIHHTDANDPTRLVMPPSLSLIIGSILFFTFRSVLGNSAICPFFGGFVVGYLCYDYTHFYVHFARPKTGFGKWLKKYHMDHHFVSPNARWGVSTPIWDYVFRTNR